MQLHHRLRALHRRPLSLLLHPQVFVHHRHYAKRTTKTKVSSLLLPQGPLTPLPPLDPPSKPTPRYPPVIQQAYDTISRLPDSTVLLTRVGGFYELYFSHASIYAPKLGIKVTTKSTARGPISFAGFPMYQLDRYLKILVEEEGKFVAVCEEFGVEGEGAAGGGRAQGGLKFERRIARVVTPGTLVDEEWVEQGGGNYLLSVEKGKKGDVGLAWVDLGTGDWWTEVCHIEELKAEIIRIAPKEVVVEVGDVGLVKGVEEMGLMGEGFVVAEFGMHGREGLGWENTVAEDGDGVGKLLEGLEDIERYAGDRLLAYVKDRLPQLDLRLQPPTRRDTGNEMAIDPNSMRTLEIRETIRDKSVRGSLLYIVDRTVTKGGKRLLGRWLTSPSTDISTIESRLDLVQVFLDDETLRSDLVSTLEKSFDSQRILQKFSLGRGDQEDLIALARTINVTADIRDRLKKVKKNKNLKALVDQFEIPQKLADAILSAIDEEGLMEKQRVEESEAAAIRELANSVIESEEIGYAEEESGVPEKPKAKKSRRIMKPEDREKAEPWVMQRNASPTLKILHQNLDELMKEKDNLEESLREELSAPSLSLKWSPNLGHHLHTKRSRDTTAIQAHPSARSVSSSRTTHSFHFSSWTALGQSIDQTRQAIRKAELDLFNKLRNQVIAALPPLRRNALLLSNLDVTTSFAVLAVEKSLIRPQLSPNPVLTIMNGRHITVETSLATSGRSFTSNSLVLSPPQSKFWLITGPNMAGKSTFLRQNALIIILAQSGCFVPATHATIGIVDKLFSRVGSADNLFADQSTFMVEMLETGTILRNATRRSFVIMDEVGRGTTPKDGEAMAYASLEYLAKATGCRGLFATHFHGVVTMAENRGVNGVECWCTDVLEDGEGGWSYVHRLRKGVNTQSHALKVAALAGVPKEVLDVAEEVLKTE